MLSNISCRAIAPYLTQYRLTNTKKPGKQVDNRDLMLEIDRKVLGKKKKITRSTHSEVTVLTLDKLGSFGTLKPLEEQNENLFPVLNDGLSEWTKKKHNCE